MKKFPTLSIVIPAFNEEKIIEKSLEKTVSYLKKRRFSWEVVVADDGSKDNTSKLVKKFTGKGVRLIRLKENQGKGAALKTGILNAKGKYIIFMDADLSVPLKNIEKFVKEIEKGKDVVIASRRVSGAEIEVHQPWHRETMGRAFTFITRVITGVPLADFTCGFKGFSKGAARKIFKNSAIARWAYDAEIMFLADKFGFKIHQLPVRWMNRGDTRVRLKTVVFETFRDLIKIRINDFLRVYDK